MQIYTILAKLEQLVETSPRPKIGGNAKRIVDVDAFFDLVGDLKVTIPEDIRRANTVLLEADNMIANAGEHARDMVEDAHQQADAVMAEAQVQALQIVEEAERQYAQLVDEHVVLEEARRRADVLEQKAQTNAVLVYDGAKQYADEILADINRFLGEYQVLVNKNREELDVRKQPPVLQQQAEKRAAAPSVAQAQAAPASGEAQPLEDDAYGHAQQPDKSWRKRGRREDYPGQEREEAYDQDYEDDEDYEGEEDEYSEPRPRWSLFRRKKKDMDFSLDEE